MSRLGSEATLRLIADSDDPWAVGDAIVKLSLRKGLLPNRRGSGDFIRELANEMRSRGGKRQGEYSLRVLRDTAWAYDEHERRAGVVFSAHVEVRNREERDELLDWYEERAKAGAEPTVKDFQAYARGRRGPSKPGTFTTYRFYRSDGGLLYVGRDSNWPERRRVHERTASWWGEVSKEIVTHYSTREAMVNDENQAIQNEQPTYNSAGTRT